MGTQSCQAAACSPVAGRQRGNHGVARACGNQAHDIPQAGGVDDRGAVAPDGAVRGGAERERHAGLLVGSRVVEGAGARHHARGAYRDELAAGGKERGGVSAKEYGDRAPTLFPYVQPPAAVEVHTCREQAEALSQIVGHGILLGESQDQERARRKRDADRLRGRTAGQEGVQRCGYAG